MMHFVHFMNEAESSGYRGSLKSELGNLHGQMECTSCAVICVFHNSK